jgi:hypothetical protein
MHMFLIPMISAHAGFKGLTNSVQTDRLNTCALHGDDGMQISKPKAQSLRSWAESIRTAVVRKVRDRVGIHFVPIHVFISHSLQSNANKDDRPTSPSQLHRLGVPPARRHIYLAGLPARSVHFDRHLVHSHSTSHYLYLCIWIWICLCLCSLTPPRGIRRSDPRSIARIRFYILRPPDGERAAPRVLQNPEWRRVEDDRQEGRRGRDGGSGAAPL